MRPRSWMMALLLEQGRAHRWTRAVLIALLVPMSCYGLSRVRLFEDFENRTEDLRYRIRGPLEVDPRLLLVKIDDATLRAYGGVYPLPRTHHANLVRGLLSCGASVIGLDFLFIDPSSNPLIDEALAGCLEVNPERTVVGAYFREIYAADEHSIGIVDSPGSDRPAAPFAIAAPPHSDRLVWGETLDLPTAQISSSGTRIGHVNLIFGERAQGDVRSMPMLIASRQGVIPAISLSVWMAAQEIAPSQLSIELEQNRVTLRRGSREILRLPPSGAIEINHIGTERDLNRNSASYIDILNQLRPILSNPEIHTPGSDALRDRLRGKIVLVGLTGVSTIIRDHKSTPFGAQIPNLLSHASALNNLLLHNAIRRLPLGVEHISIALILLSTALFVPRTGRRRAVSVGVLGSLLFMAASQFVFTSAHIMVLTVTPLMALIGGVLLIEMIAFAQEERQRRLVESMFSAYVSDHVLELLRSSPDVLAPANELTHATALFVDIRGYTAWSTGLEPQELLVELNGLLEQLVEVVLDNGGYVNKFLGDGLMAVFGVPVRGSSRPAHVAADTAIGMLGRIAVVNRSRAAGGKPALEIGIGLATGDVVAGCVGSSRRLEYTVVGNAVNLASRLQALAEAREILVDKKTAEELRSDMPAGRLRNTLEVEAAGYHAIKGLGEVEVFRLREG